MKYLILALAVLLQAPNASAIEEFIVAKHSIKYLQHNLKGDYLDEVTLTILRNAHKYNLDWKIMAAIIAQESSFKKDPQHCSRHINTCIDLGIGQINYETWKEEFHLNKRKLLRDMNYNIDVMAQILSKLRDMYGPQGSRRHEKRWHTRYHSFTWKHRKIYADFIYHKYLILTAHSDGFRKGYGYDN